MDNAQNIEDWGIHQMEVANARIPYASTLVQTESEGPSLWGLGGVTYGPAYPSPQPFIRGEKQWMENAQNIEDWGIHQMEVANARIPYASTFVQTKDDDHAEPESDFEKDTDMSILYEKDEPVTAPEKVGPRVPNSL